MDRKRSGCRSCLRREATANCRGADGVQPAVVPMEQPAPTTTQNTNDDEEEEILIDTEGKQVVFTLAEVGRRADGDGIDTESPCIGPLRAVQFLKVASQHGVLERLPLTTEQRALDEKIKEIKAAASSCVENSAVSFFDNLAKRGVAPSARDAAVSVSLCRKTERLFRKRVDDLDTSDVRRAGFDLRRLARGFGERRKPGLSREWQERFKERDADAHKEWLEQRTRDLSRWGQKGGISQFHADEAAYARALEARVSKLEEIRDSGTLPGGATGLHCVLVGGISLLMWCDKIARNDDNIINRMLLDRRPLVVRLAKLADKDYDALVDNYTQGFSTARAIHRMALTCKKRLDDDWSPVGDDELMTNSNFGKYTIDEEIYQLLRLRNEAIRKGVPVDVAEKVTDWDVISYAPPSLATQPWNASAQAHFIDPSQQKYRSANEAITDTKGLLKAPTKDQLMTRLAGKHPDSLVSDVQFKEEFAAELRSLGASDEVVDLVSQSWVIKRDPDGSYRKYVDESGEAVSMLDAKKRFCPELYPEPAPGEALDDNWASRARLLLKKIKEARERKVQSTLLSGGHTSRVGRLNMEDLRELLTSFGFTGPPGPWPLSPHIKSPKHWPKSPKKFIASVVAVVRYLEGALREVDAKAGGVGVGVGVDEEGVEDVDDALPGSASAPAPSNLDSDDEKDRNFLDTVYRSSKAEQISGSAPAPAPVALDSSDDDDDDSEMRDDTEASAKEYERFMTEQEAKLYGQIGSPDEKKESDSLSSDEPKYLGTNPPPADAAAISMHDFGVHPNAPPPAVAPVPVAAPAQVEVAEEPTPASSPRPPRDLDLVDSEEAKKVERDYDDEAEF